MKFIYFNIIALLIAFPTVAQEVVSPISIDKVLITSNLSHPTALADANDGSQRLFVCEQEGRIRIVEKGKLLEKPFLDISSQVIKNKGYDERGLLGLAFHPQFKNNGKFYVYCSMKVTGAGRGIDHQSVLMEFMVAKENKDLANPASSKVVLAFNEPESNHNGGDIKFGKDGYLYIATGDGGNYNDLHGQFGNAQNLNSLLGKILRIDINTSPYSIPKDNPFVGKGDTKPEIYAYGFRNPWRISFDKENGQLFVGDVGQDNFEEVDLVKKGGNYGWRIREGLHEKFPKDPDPKNWIDPIAEYPHTAGISITGGYVYRGTQIPALKGKYVYADWMGPIWALTETKTPQWSREKLSLSKDPGEWHIYSFGEDSQGELYILSVLLGNEKGALYKVVRK